MTVPQYIHASKSLKQSEGRECCVHNPRWIGEGKKKGLNALVTNLETSQVDLSQEAVIGKKENHSGSENRVGKDASNILQVKNLPLRGKQVKQRATTTHCVCKCASWGHVHGTTLLEHTRPLYKKSGRPRAYVNPVGTVHGRNTTGRRQGDKAGNHELEKPRHSFQQGVTNAEAGNLHKSRTIWCGKRGFLHNRL